MDEFECYIRKYRILMNLTQEELAQMVEVRRETIMRLEGGKYNPSLKLAMSISRVLDVPINVLFVFRDE